MSAIQLNGATSGSVTLSPPAVAGTNTITIPAESGVLVTSVSQYIQPAGSIIFHTASTAPSGYLKANGAAISRTTYAALFAVLGTTFGAGDGSTTFNLPDMRGYFPRGWVDNGSVDSGRAFGSTQADDFLSHSHSYPRTYQNRYPAAHWTGGNIMGADASGSAIWTDTGTLNTGGTETRPKNVALLACIKF